MKDRIRIAVSGLGRIGWDFHCKSIAADRRFELAAVCDPLAERRKEAETAHGCRAYGDFSEMLSHPGLEAVVVASPTHLHLGQAVASLRRGLHLFLEKPMAASLAEARAIASAARRAGRLLTVYQPHRAAAYYRHFSNILESGRIGEVYHVRRGMFRYALRDDWQGLRRFGGGMLNNYGAHALDQVLFIIGYDVRRVFAQRRLVASLGDAEDVVKIVFETGRGLLGEVDINQASARSPYGLEAWGTLGAAAAGEDGNIRLWTVKGGRLPPAELDRSLASPGRCYPRTEPVIETEDIAVDMRFHCDVYGNLFRAIRGKEELLVPPAQTLAVMKVIEMCRAQGRIVRTPAPRTGFASRARKPGK